MVDTDNTKHIYYQQQLRKHEKHATHMQKLRQIKLKPGFGGNYAITHQAINRLGLLYRSQGLHSTRL